MEELETKKYARNRLRPVLLYSLAYTVRDRRR